MVKRYDYGSRTKHFYEDEYEVHGVYEDDRGNYIKFDDYQLLEKRLAEVERINLELSSNVEACCELVDMDMGAAIDRLFEIDNTESKALLNKFAIEQQIKALEDLELNPQNESEDRLVSLIESHIEQLRKQQESNYD